MTKEPPKPIIIYESKIRNEITITRQDLVITLSTDEEIDKAFEKFYELMEKYGGQKK